jgi:Concanavalin A-like lectin/glucanases superfamily
MEYLLLFIFIIVVLLIIYIFYEFYKSSFFLSSNDSIYGMVNLNTPPIETISSTNLTNPSSPRYAIGAWIYINSWNSNDYKILITKTPFTTSGTTFSDIDYNFDFCLYLDKTQPNLQYQMTSIQSSIPIQPITIMSGFPLQTWTHVIVSIDTQIIDAYINGKLVLSHKLSSLPQNTNSGIFFGNGSPADIKINHFERWATSMDPQTAWETYQYTNPSKLA